MLLCTTIFLLSALGSAGDPLPAQSANAPYLSYRTGQLAMHDGLQHNYVDDILCDSRGFLWFALGGGGLSRYDGHELLNLSERSSGAPLKSNFVISIAEDPYKRLWVATDAGLNVVDIKNLTECTPDKAPAALQNVLDMKKASVCKDAQGRMWIADNECVACLTFGNEGNIDAVSMQVLPHRMGTTPVIKDVCSDGAPWICVGGTVYRAVTVDKKLRFVAVDDRLSFSPDVTINDFREKEGEIWLASNIGLMRYYPIERTLRTYRNSASDPFSISQNFVSALALTDDNKLLAGTLNGLNIYNPATDGFRHISDSTVPSLNSNFINCIAAVGNIIFLGTESAGVNILAPPLLQINNIYTVHPKENALPCTPVNALLETPDRRVWIGSVEGGLSVTSPEMKSFTRYTVENSGAITHNSVSALTAKGTKQLWAGSWGGGVDWLDISGTTPRLIKHVSSASVNGETALLDYIGSLTYDSINNLVWIGCRKGLFIMSAATGEVTEPFPGAAQLNVGFIGAATDNNGQLWLGSYNGIYIVNLHSQSPKTGFFSHEHLPNLLNPNDSKMVEKISFISKAHNADMLIASNGNGIYRYSLSPKGDRLFRNINSSHGLCNDIVRGITEDSSGNIWVSTCNGLSCIDSNDNITSFSLTDGIANDQYYWNAALHLSNNTMAFGNVAGITIIPDNTSFETGKDTHPIHFTSVSIGGEPLDPDRRQEIGDKRVLNLHESEYGINIAISAFDYSFAGGFYRYKLEGLDNEWRILSPGENLITFNTLPPGKYLLKIEYLTNGHIVTGETELKVNVSAYLYKRPWFIALVVLMLAGIAFLWYRWRIKRLEHQKQELEKAVADRTAKIYSQQEQLKRHADTLTRQNEQLSASNAEITEQKSRIAEMAAQVQQMTVDRLSFFTNITHEFRTPITLIIGPIQRALKLSVNPKVIEQLHLVERNSQYLLTLVNQLMDFRKVESGKMEIVRRSGNFILFLDELVVPFKLMASDRNIDLRLCMHISSPWLCYDESALQKVISNLISNALKFTPDNGRITIYAALLESRADNGHMTMYISVSDTGCGIADADLPRLFDHFYQGTNPIKYPVVGQGSSGIGLFLCKSIVEVYGGTIAARNNPSGSGCSFRMTLPIEPATDKCPDSEENDSPAPAAELSVNTDLKPQTNELTILVVEDNADMRGYIRSILADSYNVVEAESGEQALQILLNREIDFIISDLAMPGMSGLELSKKVKETFAISHIPFLILTAHASEKSRLDSFKVGVDEYLLKPFNEELLLTRVRNILENRTRSQSRFGSAMKLGELNIDNTSRDKKFLDQLMTVIHDNYRNANFEVGDMAETLCISRSLLNKKVQGLAGQSPNQLLRTYRLNLARELLIATRHSKAMNISEIAYEVGFNDPKYFTRCFTKHFNLTPSALVNGQEEC